MRASARRDSEVGINIDAALSGRVRQLARARVRQNTSWYAPGTSQRYSGR